MEQLFFQVFNLIADKMSLVNHTEYNCGQWSKYSFKCLKYFLKVMKLLLILILLLILFRDTPTNEIGIVSMMKNPIDLDYWLSTHRKMGVSKFYIRLEDPDPVTEQYLRNQPGVYLETGKSTGVNEYAEIQVRQNNWVNKVIGIKDNITWLIHIDSDEILEGDLNEIKNLPGSVNTFWMQNAEAVYKDIPKKGECFTASKFINCAEGKCVSYGNGKGGGRKSKIVANGPHRMKSDTGTEVKLKLILRHYESCDFDAYKNKFKRLSVQNKEPTPFPYYNESMDAAKMGENKLKCVYKKYRTESGRTSNC